VRTVTALVFATPLVVMTAATSMQYFNLISSSTTQILAYTSFLISIVGLALAIYERVDKDAQS
jgi:hypothetical protein